MEGLIGKKSLSFPIEPGPHRVHMTYENVAVPPEWTNLAILNYSIEVMVSDGTSSSSYQPDEGYPEPVSTEDEGKTCRANAGRRLLAAMAPRAVPVLPVRRKTTEKGITVKMRIPAPVKTMRAAAAALRRAARSSSTPYGSSAAGRRVVARTLKTEMIWCTNFGSFRGMTGLPQGLLEMVGYTFSAELWSPRALHYWHPMTREIISAPSSGIGANTAFQIRSGGTAINYYCYADGDGSRGGQRGPHCRIRQARGARRGSGGDSFLRQGRENSASVSVQTRAIPLTIPQVRPLP